MFSSVLQPINPLPLTINWNWRHVESNTGKSRSLTRLAESANDWNLTRRCREISLCLALFAGVWFYFSLLSAVFSFVFVYVLLADDHVNNGNVRFQSFADSASLVSERLLPVLDSTCLQYQQNERSSLIFTHWTQKRQHHMSTLEMIN
jgi:hypothetical protein